MNDFLKFMVIFMVALVVVPILSFAFGYLLYLVWNKILVDVVSVFNVMSYWKAYFLTLACMLPSSVGSVYKSYKDE